MSKIQSVVDYAIRIAKDDTHGYDQVDRWGHPNFDCSGLVITAFEQAGIPVKTNGATYTGNMKKAFLKTGFIDVIKTVNLKTGAGLVTGDVLLKEGSHTALYIGNGQIVHASINEKGGIKGGKSGDQTGKEILVAKYYNKPWNCVLRYAVENPSSKPVENQKEQQGINVRVTAYGLNIRLGAGTGYSIVGVAHKGDILTIYEKALNGTTQWGRTDKGWVSLKFTEVVK